MPRRTDGRTDGQMPRRRRGKIRLAARGHESFSTFLATPPLFRMSSRHRRTLRRYSLRTVVVTPMTVKERSDFSRFSLESESTTVRARRGPEVKCKVCGGNESNVAKVPSVPLSPSPSPHDLAIFLFLPTSELEDFSTQLHRWLNFLE